MFSSNNLQLFGPENHLQFTVWKLTLLIFFSISLLALLLLLWVDHILLNPAQVQHEQPRPPQSPNYFFSPYPSPSMIFNPTAIKIFSKNDLMIYCLSPCLATRALKQKACLSLLCPSSNYPILANNPI